MKNYVIIGNGTAAAGCLEGIRSVDKEASVTIISEESRHVYSRPLISYYLEGKTDLHRMLYRPYDFYEKNNCKVLYSLRAERIDPAQKKVLLSDGSQLSYDALCVATGSVPFVPDIKGLEGVGKKFTFMTLDDALAIEGEVSKDSRVLILGAGLIGLKAAEGLHKRAGSISVTDISGHVLPSILDEECAALVRSRFEQEGVSFLLGESVAMFDSNVAVMSDGRQIQFDILIMAAGVRPNAKLVRNAGGACGRGIAVDEHMRTSLPDIYAAGDCTESLDVSDNTIKVMALLPNAYMQGHSAGINMAGGESVFDKAIPMNSIGFFGLHIMTAGNRTAPAEGGEAYEEITDKGIKKLYVKDGRLVGFVLVGEVDRAGIYTDLIRSGTPLEKVDFERLKKNPDLFALDAKFREQRLGGVV
ncbi:MAG: NAD(P)/FAD-dependent oxidoreductase [Clostridiales bacterium]|nr:NAD(P)/FAD-dependent oxidoreductase [Clostridiales bacterium]HOA85028.1 FAD-dependent oxidoreductase [Bacillota bacterium]